MSFETVLPIKYSSLSLISLTFAADKSLICLAVILLPAATYTLLFTLMSTESVSPLSLSGIKANLTPSFSNVYKSSS